MLESGASILKRLVAQFTWKTRRYGPSKEYPAVSLRAGRGYL